MNKAFFPDIIVNGTTIPSAAIAAEAQNHEAPQGKPGLAWRKAARALIIRHLLLEEGGKRNISESPRNLGEGRRETEDEALIRGVIDAAVEVSAPTAGEVEKMWSEDPDRYRSPPLWEVSHILCAADPSDPAAREKAQLRAQTLSEMVQKSPKNFVRIAKENSDCGSKSNGGALGQLSPGDTVPEFEAVLRVLDPEEITSEPVGSRFGFHIIRMDAVAIGQPLPFSAVEPKLSAAMEKASWTKGVQLFTQGLVQKAEIVGIDLNAI